MANPAFSEKAIRRVASLESTDKMTIEGTINKTGILLALLVAGAAVGWTSSNGLLLVGSLLINMVLALCIIFGPHRAAYLSQPYAFLEGILLGSISVLYSNVYPGIVTNALGLTIGVFGLMLGMYKYKVITVTEKVRTVIVSATAAIALVYLASMILRLFSIEIPMIHESGAFGIIFSLAVVGVAAFNLLLDFDMIEKTSNAGFGKAMEWYGGFALVLTIVWLYLEILRLLSKLNRK